jgi:hypothetical protein
MKKKLHIHILSYLLLLCIAPQAISQVPNVILGRPTDSSVTMSVMFDEAAEFRIRTGLQPGIYTLSTQVLQYDGTTPLEILRDSLKPDSRYYYTLEYRPKSSLQPFTIGNERTLVTQRRKGSSFNFIVEADPHLDTNTIPASLQLSLRHMLTKSPDFLVDLGDNFMNDKLPVINGSTITERNVLFRNYWQELCHSSSLFVAMGNHEGELGWLPDTGPTSLPSMAANIRKTHIPNPSPGSIYTGNNTPSPFVGLRENYYAWEWGDALFVVIDPYINTKSKAGWGWTLGKEQYEWLKNTLRNTRATFKFIFSHQIVGGTPEGRGGTELVHLYEMGGSNQDGSWGFTANRPGWEKPLHQLFQETGVNIFFHGHDHFFGKQERDGIIYQEVPQPSARNLTMVTGTAYGYVEGVLLPNRGYILGNVTPDSVRIDYVRTYLPNEENASRKNGDIAFSYTIRKSPVTGLIQVQNGDLFHVYPNPAREYLEIQLKHPNALNYEYTIIDMQGRPLKKGRDRLIDVRDLPKGPYLLRVRTNQFLENRRIIIGGL